MERIYFAVRMAAGLFSFFICLGLGDPAAAAMKPGAIERDLDFIQSVFEAGYAPQAWKTKHLGWSLETAIRAAKDEASGKGPLTTKEYQKILKRFFNSTQDYHVGVQFHATETARLPLEIRSAKTENGERVYILVAIDRKKLPESAFPFQVGDQVVSFDGRPIAEVASEIRAAISQGTEATDQSMTELYLTRRIAATTMNVPQGPVMLEILPQGKEKSLRRQLIWDYKAEKVKSPMILPLITTASGETGLGARLNKEMKAANAWLFKRWLAEEGNNPHMIGARESFVPVLGKKAWETEKENSFHAYIFRGANGKLFGYVRIPSYGAGEKQAKEFATILKRFNDVTDGLVIDQIHNPGGSVYYLYSLVAMLTKEPVFAPHHRMSLTQKDIAEAVEGLQEIEAVTNDEEAKKALGETIGGYPVDLQVVQFFRAYYQFQIDEWNRGKTLTEPHFLGIDRINPHPEVQYDKPILVLINELDFSGGDFFPAILQDNKLAKIMGVRTAGAGGYVQSLEYPNHFGVAGFTYTASLAERVNKEPIENLGVQPDILYELTEKDLREGYKGYADAIKNALQDLVK